MIIREAPVDNAWYRASVMWFVALLGVNCLAWPALDYHVYDLSNLWWLACVWPIGSIILWSIGKFISEPTRVTAFALVIGLFGYLPLLFGLLLPLLSLLAITRTDSDFALPFIGLFAVLSAFWIYMEIRELRKNIIIEKFLQREFRIGTDAIYLNRSPTTDLDAAHQGTLPTVLAVNLSKLVFILPSAYPLQRLLSDSGGAPAVLLFLSILGTPFAVYVLGSMSRGFYLWIYLVRELERQHGKPVILQPSI